MSKASQIAFESGVAKAKRYGGAAWIARARAILPGGESVVGRDAGESMENGGIVDMHVVAGSSENWAESMGSGHLRLRVHVEPGASLRWLCGRQAGAEASSREVGVSLEEGASFDYVQSFELARGQSHAEVLKVVFKGPRAKALIVSRFAQGAGSELCQEVLGHITPNAQGAEFAQSSKALRFGGAAATLIEPNLKVEVDEASARHGAAHGEVPPESAHALRARGFSPQQAETMLKQAFLAQAWEDAQASDEERRLVGLAPLEDLWN